MLQRIAIMRIIIIVALCALFWTNQTLAKALTAQVDRSHVAYGETIQLRLRINQGSIFSSPNLNPLLTNFRIINTSQSTQLQVINGKQSIYSEWIINLLPRRRGKLIIPPISWGQYRSQAIPIHVSNSRSIPQHNSNRSVFLDVSITPHSPYVQSQALYTVRLYFAIPLRGGNIIPPKSQHAIIQQLGDDITYGVVSHEKRYEVLQRQYAVFAQTPGKLTIEPPIFNGQAIPPVQSNDPINSIMSPNLVPLHLVGKTITLNIKPKPAQVKPSKWLPARKLRLSQHWSTKPPQFRVGVPITRSISLTATGLSGAQLPKISIAPLNNAKVYPDQPMLTNQVDGHWITGKRVEKIAYIPTHSGKITLPAITIPWWDTITHKERIAQLPAATYTVSGAATAMNNSLTNHKATNVTKSALAKLPKMQSWSANKTITTNHQTVFNAWLYIAIGALLAWLITLFAWYRQSHKSTKSTRLPRKTSVPRNKSNDRPGRLSHGVKKACQNNDPLALQRALIAFYQSLWPKVKLRNIGDIIAFITTNYQPDEQFIIALRELTTHIYGKGQDAAWDGQTLWRLFKQQKFTKQPGNTTNGASLIAPLFMHSTNKND